MDNSISYILCHFATLGPIGRKLPAPGTAGSIVAIFAGYILHPIGWLPFLLLTLAVSFLGVIAADNYSKTTNTHDSGKIIIDEVVGQWTTLLFIPYDVMYFIAALFLFRFFDITKIWPVSWAERLNGGLGIVADDLVAGLMAGIILFFFCNWRDIGLG